MVVLGSVCLPWPSTALLTLASIASSGNKINKLLTALSFAISTYYHIFPTFHQVHDSPAKQFPVADGDGEVFDENFLGSWGVEAVDCVS
jgi:hypothetical protein